MKRVVEDNVILRFSDIDLAYSLRAFAALSLRLPDDFLTAFHRRVLTDGHLQSFGVASLADTFWSLVKLDRMTDAFFRAWEDRVIQQREVERFELEQLIDTKWAYGRLVRNPPPLLLDVLKLKRLYIEEYGQTDSRGIDKPIGNDTTVTPDLSGALFELLEAGKFTFSHHAADRQGHRGISTQDVHLCVSSCSRIVRENLESWVLTGKGVTGMWLKVVIGWSPKGSRLPNVVTVMHK